MKLFSRVLWCFMLVTAALFIFAQPTSAALGGTLTGTSLNEADCYVEISAVVEDAGFYAINMWDDGNFRGGAGAQVPAGGTLIVRFYIGGVILQGATGIGIYLEDGVGPAAITTYDFDGNAQLWSDAVGTACQTAGTTFSALVTFAGIPGTDTEPGTGTEAPCLNPLPAGAVLYSVPAGAPAFFAPDLGSQTNFNLPAGTWYITEFTGDFAKVWIACAANMIYIPANAVAH